MTFLIRLPRWLMAVLGTLRRPLPIPGTSPDLAFREGELQELKAGK